MLGSLATGKSCPSGFGVAIQALGEALQQNSSITTLDLRREIGDKGAKAQLWCQ